jgi:hypothetical protein
VNRVIRINAPHTLLPVLDEYEPIGSTDRIAFVTAKSCEPTVKSHLSHAVCDSKLEVGIVHELEQDPRVVAYAKNDRLFLEIPYRYLGKTLRYRPDFIVKLASGVTLLIEGKGKADEKVDAKATAARRWVAAVNSWGKLGGGTTPSATSAPGSAPPSRRWLSEPPFPHSCSPTLDVVARRAARGAYRRAWPPGPVLTGRRSRPSHPESRLVASRPTPSSNDSSHTPF